MLVAVGLSPLAAELGRSERWFWSWTGAFVPSCGNPRSTCFLASDNLVQCLFLLSLAVFTLFYPQFAASSSVVSVPHASDWRLKAKI